MKNYTKTYKNKRNINYDTRKIRVYMREDCTAKIHEKRVKNPPKSSSQSRDGYISQPCTQLCLTRLAYFATTSSKLCVCSQWTSLQRGQSSPQTSTRWRHLASRETSPWRSAPSSGRRGGSSTTSGCPSAAPRFSSTRLTWVSSSPSPSSRAGA